ncbi:hypothetical protein VTN77DRAFT_4362 [Rasamsonia byssochlamydoides]|uniref:uncharacterized protein n=1 Tax=Rasamsonia byssochlamydoides TaxID=89139 RepID=UPI0037437775
MVVRAKPDASYASTRLTRRNYTGESLLSQVGGKKIREDSRYGKKSDGIDGQKEVETKTKTTEKRYPEPATDDEPLSSSDESVDTRVSSGSGKDHSAGPKENGNNTGSTQSNNGRSGGERRSARQKPAVHQQQEQRPSLKRTFSQTLDQEEDELFPSFMSSSQAVKRRKNASYGGLKNIHVSSSFRTPSSSIENALSPQRPSPGFKNPKKIPGVEDSPVNKPEDDKNNGFRVPMDIDLDSPVSKSRTRSKKTSDKSSSDSGFQMPRGPNDHDVAVYSSQGAEFKEPPPLPSNGISSSSFTSSNPMVDFDNDTPLSPLSPLSSISSDFSVPEDIVLSSKGKTSEPVANRSLCPMCKEPVDPALLQEFLSQSNQRVREQQRFCEGHKKRTAEKEWADRGYPTIDWDTFDERIRRHFPSLEKILVPDCSSFYRNILHTAMKTGKAKNFRLTMSGDSLENLSCGYYGSKGASRMLNAVTTEFSHKLRRLAAFDNVIKTAGVAAYAQAVLVPELTVLLVKEDMGVSDEDARQIMRDSMDIGEKLNSAPNDVVPVQDDLTDNN